MTQQLPEGLSRREPSLPAGYLPSPTALMGIYQMHPKEKDIKLATVLPEGC